MKRRAGFVFLVAFVACVWAANYAIAHWGNAPAFPGGPHTVTLLGLTAPSGVLIVGLSFTFRDLAQWALGRWWVVVGLAAGAILAALTASPGLAAASCVAFGFSETLDWLVYTPLADRGQWLAGLTVSNTVGSAVDSLLFLAVAFGWSSLHAFFWPQFWLKALMTLPAIAVLAPWRIRAVLARRSSPTLARVD